MTRRVVSVELDDQLSTVKEIFEQVKFRHLLVIEEGKLFGVVSDRDLLKAISPNIGTSRESNVDLATLKKRVHQIVSRNPITLPPTASVLEAITLFNTHSVSCIPVVDDQNRALGILSWRDILRALGEHPEQAPRLLAVDD